MSNSEDRFARGGPVEPGSPALGSPVLFPGDHIIYPKKGIEDIQKRYEILRAIAEEYEKEEKE